MAPTIMNLLQPTKRISQDFSLPNTSVAQNQLGGTKGRIAELFSGIQGEGHWVGQRQLFLRFIGCDLRCQWCDSPDSLVYKEGTESRIEQTPGKRDFAFSSNPHEVFELAKQVANMDAKLEHHSMSLTGGEPLLQANFIAQLLHNLRFRHNFAPKIFLETGGHRPDELKQVIEYLDFLSFDLKLPSSTLDKPLWNKHIEFIEVASQKQGYAKAVLTAETTDDDVRQAAELIKQNGNSFDLILQPVALIPQNSNYSVPSPEQMLDWQALTVKVLGRGRVQVIPQTHKFLNQL
jgi:7-carboxy-7-deazaguanine synthase